ncbi:MAG: TAT-variant-translocated molybdopterin oxidoreductase [bacterium]|nr:TAT-variant-translocated molybdopterin oxidoreductase [bacterium]
MDNRPASLDPSRFWRLADERAGDPRVAGLAAREFVPGSAQAPEDPAAGMSRRRFLGLLGASAALAAGTAGCGRDIDRGSIVPYTRRPEDGQPGRAVWYATSWAEGCWAFPLLVKTREARPILIEGNDRHGDSQGSAPVRAQAELLALYDPERLQGPRRESAAVTWEEAETALAAALRGGRALLVVPAVLSPARQALLERLEQALPALEIVSWEAAAPHGALAASAGLSGAQLLPRLHLDRAQVVLGLEAELFSGEGEVTRQIRGFVAGRHFESREGASPRTMNRLWAAESRMTLTGGKSDQRLPLRASRLGALGFALARRLGELGRTLPAGLPAGPSLAELAAAEGLDAALLEQLAQDLQQADRAALVVAGHSADADAHAAAWLLNHMLGAEGHTVELRPAALRPLATPAALAALAGRLARGEYSAAVLWEANPLYDAPGDWTQALAGVDQRFRLGTLPDESAAACAWTLATHHWLESWGDLAGGLLQQPVVAPLYDTRQGEDLFLAVLRGLGQDVPTSAEDWLKSRWRGEWTRLNSPLAFEAFWHSALHDGFATQPAAVPPPAGRWEALARLAPAAAPTEGLELVLHADRHLGDGRGANIGWLQELPDPVTKCTWGNPLALSPADARRLGLQDGDSVRLAAAGHELACTALVQPGQREGTIALALGHGRRALGVAEGIGVNAFPLLADGRFILSARLERAGGKGSVHTTQEHHLMEGRDLVRSLSVAAYAAGGTGAPDHGGGHDATLPTGHDHGVAMEEQAPLSLYPDHEYKGHKWGMVIDLTACVGCAGCVIACQAENNIPVVGPERIDEGREMHWLRIDRYYEGGLDNPDMVFQPMLCQHCDHAPCENVCPVAATTHSEDGLNQMTYNRCVGTRYCANNCPYKVRHFNYFDYTGGLAEVLQLAANPEVSIRPRGVMEKCTFCVQRIQVVRSQALSEGRPVADGEVRPACAVACAAGAITFGDLNGETLVARRAASDRRHKVLEELGVRPAVTYLAEVRNPIAAGDAHES